MHTNAHRGTPVICFLRDGTQIRGKFIKRHSKYVELDTATIAKKQLRAMTIYRAPTKKALGVVS